MHFSGIYGIFNKSLKNASFDFLAKTELRFSWLKSWVVTSDAGCVTFLYNQDKASRITVSASNAGEELSVLFSGRIDNRLELIKSLDVAFCDTEKVSNVELISFAYRKWGEDAVKRIFGDWSFAVWHSKQNKLFLARDHLGVTGLFYYEGKDDFVFSSTKDFILDSGFVKPELNELYLAQVVLGWMAYHGEGTVHSQIKRLPPAHTLTVTASNTSCRHYWQPEHSPLIFFKNRNDYVESFREIFTEAVSCRLPSEGEVAISLSGGLDSSSIASVASQLLARQNRRLTAYTSIPLIDPSCYLALGTGDEFPLAKSTARFLENVDIYPVDARSNSPISAIKRVLSITNEPSHAACNYYWMLAIRESVRDSGCKVLLNGQLGNGTISWEGDIFSQPLLYILNKIGLPKYLKNRVFSLLPTSLKNEYLRRFAFNASWLRSSAINLEFARRLKLADRRLLETSARTPVQKRSFFKPGKLNIGAQQSEISAAYGHELRDPTADPRVVNFTFAVPDQIYIDPSTDTNRWLIRETMKGRLPEEVRLNTVFGRQAADQVWRLRSTAAEVETVLSELTTGPASEFLDIVYMREIWSMIRHVDTPEVLKKTGSIFLRGIMAGLFVNKFYGYESRGG